MTTDQDETYKNMLACFRINDLQILLTAFGQNKVGRKTELQERALKMLRNKSSAYNHAAYLGKIYEIYHSMQSDVLHGNDTTMRSLLSSQQSQMMTMGQIQPPPQYPHQSMHMTRAGLQQVMPQIQRGVYGNPIGRSTMTNNNIQYVSGSYQPSRSRSIAPSRFPSNQQMNAVRQGTSGYDNTRGSAGENNPCIPSPATVAKIKFKNIPFYEVIDKIIHPTFLDGTDKCTLTNFPKGMKELSFKILLSMENVNFVVENRDISPGKCEYPYQFQIRFSQFVEPITNEVTDFMPLGLQIRVGGKNCPLPPPIPNNRPGSTPRRSPRPINCTQIMKLNPIIANTICVNWCPDGKNYIMALYLVKKITSEMLIQRLQDKGGRSSEETKDYIIKTLADVDPDFATTSYRFSLVCPLGKIRMKIPAKSIHCNHLQCFDVNTFILMNEQKPTWMCPTCGKPCFYDDIQIQNYFLDVVSSPTLEDHIKEIEILADGTWIASENNKETNSTRDTKFKPIDTVDLDSDDDKPVDPKPEPQLEIATVASLSRKNEHQLNLVDLTLSGDEEEPPKYKDKQENEAQAADAIQPVVAEVDLKPQSQVQPQQAVTSSEQGVVIEIDSPSPPPSPTTTTETA